MLYVFFEEDYLQIGISMDHADSQETVLDINNILIKTHTQIIINQPNFFDVGTF